MADGDLHPQGQLQLRPFPAMRFNPAVVEDIGEVTCPPYDVMDRAMIEDLLNAHPRNIVRLILPRLVHEPLGADDPYVTAAKRLARWRTQHTLVTDPEPGLYVYEYGDTTHRVCGLIGALELSKRHREMILPHEDVIPAIVADRLAMTVAAPANLEPILLVYDGDKATSGAIAAARERPPLTDVMASDGTFHRLWSITDGPTIGQVRDALRQHRGAHRRRPPSLRDVPAAPPTAPLDRGRRPVPGTVGSRFSSTSLSFRWSWVPSTAASPRSRCRALVLPGRVRCARASPARGSCYPGRHGAPER